MDVETIKARVDEIARSSDAAPFIDRIDVEEAMDEFDAPFLRVKIRVKPIKKNIDVVLNRFIREVEDSVAEVDERYPSVRFLDAA